MPQTELALRYLGLAARARALTIGTPLICTALSRTAKGKSMLFESLVIVGYLCGLAGKFISGNVTYVVAVYLLDIAMVTTDLLLTIRNAKLDQEREKAL